MTRTLTVLALTVLLVAGLGGVAATATIGPQQIDGNVTATATVTVGNDSVADESVADDGNGADDANGATVSVSGAGEVSAEPDRALVFVAVTATGNSSAAAAATLSTGVATLREEVNDSDVVDGVRTTDFQLFERRENGSEAFVARQSFEIGVNDTNAVGEVIDRAVASGATEVSGVSFTLSDERRGDLRASAIDRAVDDARQQATAVAGSADLELGSIRTASVDGGGLAPTRQVAVAEGTVIDVSPVTVTASVQLTYDASPR
jgi:hypothetical protein